MSDSNTWMNNNFSLEYIAETGDLKADLIKRQYKLDKTDEITEKSLSTKI